MPPWHVVLTGPRSRDQRREALDFLAVSTGGLPGSLSVVHSCPECGSTEHGVPALVPSRAAARRRSQRGTGQGATPAGQPAVSFSRAAGWLATAWLEAPAAAAGWRIGIDLEDGGAPAFEDGGLEGVGYSAAEEHQLAALSGPERRRERARLWCAKEALVKAAGTGFRSDPAEVTLSAYPGAVVVDGADWPGHGVPEGLAGAVVLLPPGSPAG